MTDYSPALDQLVGVFAHDLTILASTGLGLVGVDHKKLGAGKRQTENTYRFLNKTKRFKMKHEKTQLKHIEFSRKKLTVHLCFLA